MPRCALEEARGSCRVVRLKRARRSGILLQQSESMIHMRKTEDKPSRNARFSQLKPQDVHDQLRSQTMSRTMCPSVMSHLPVSDVCVCAFLVACGDHVCVSFQAGLQSPKTLLYRSKPKLSRKHVARCRQRVQHGFWALQTEAISKPNYRAMSQSNRSNRDLLGGTTCLTLLV